MPELYPEDQARVDKVINQGIYRVERKPFRPWLLLTILVGMLVVVFIVGYVLGRVLGFV